MTEREILKALIENAPNTYSGTDIELQQKKMFAFYNAVEEAQKYLEEPEEEITDPTTGITFDIETVLLESKNIVKGDFENKKVYL